MHLMSGGPPILIVIGGFAGTGKTALARRLSAELGVPRLGSDTIGQLIKQSEGIGDRAPDAYRIAYDVLFGLCEDFLRAGVSTIIDTNMGWAFQWQRFDTIKERLPALLFAPIILRCSRALSLERIERRHASDPINNDPPERFTEERKHVQIWEFLERLDRSDIHFVDATASQDEVYEEITQHLTVQFNTVRGKPRGLIMRQPLHPL